jgi:hypothetical protein
MDVEARVRHGIKAVLEEVLEEEMTQHLQAVIGSSPQPGVASATVATSVTS